MILGTQSDYKLKIQGIQSSFVSCKNTTKKNCEMKSRKVVCPLKNFQVYPSRKIVATIENFVMRQWAIKKTFFLKSLIEIAAFYKLLIIFSLLLIGWKKFSFLYHFNHLN